MIDWGKAVLLFLRVIEVIFDYLKAQGYIQQGRDEEIARQAAAILAKTQWAKANREKINAMDEKAVDDALRALEPKS